MKYLLILLILLTSCARSVQPMTAEQIKQKQERKKEYRQILNYVLLFNVVFLVVLYDQDERLNK